MEFEYAKGREAICVVFHTVKFESEGVERIFEKRVVIESDEAHWLFDFLC